MRYVAAVAVLLAALLGGCGQDRRCGDLEQAERMAEAHQKEK